MNNKTVIGILIIIVVALVGYWVLTAPDNRTAGDKISDAWHALPNGVDKASRQLEDRTPGQKLGDAVKDTGDKVGDKIKDNTQSN